MDKVIAAIAKRLGGLVGASVASVTAGASPVPTKDDKAVVSVSGTLPEQSDDIPGWDVSDITVSVRAIKLTVVDTAGMLVSELLDNARWRGEGVKIRKVVLTDNSFGSSEDGSLFERIFFFQVYTEIQP